MLTLEWDPDAASAEQLAQWCRHASDPGMIRAVFSSCRGGADLMWRTLEPWTRSRAVTVAEVCADLVPPALDVALCSDLIYLHDGVELDGGDGKPSFGVIWAAGRAGSPALARCLLDTRALGAEEAVRLGLAQGVLAAGEDLPVPEAPSYAAITIARDLMRSAPGTSASRQLELAAFRLLFAAGDPGEGARAFLEQRPPDFCGGR